MPRRDSGNAPVQVPEIEWRDIPGFEGPRRPEARQRM